MGDITFLSFAGTELGYEGLRPFTRYLLTVQAAGAPTPSTVTRRFRDFSRLHESLLSLPPGARPANADLPVMSSKTWGLGRRPWVIEARKATLAAYLARLSALSPGWPAVRILLQARSYRA